MTSFVARWLVVVLVAAGTSIEAADYDPFAPGAPGAKRTAQPVASPGPTTAPAPRRGPAPGNSPAAARPARPDVIASVEFVGADITAIFKMISDLTGWSIVLSPEVSKSPPKINIWIKNLTPEQVMEEVTRMASLVMERKGNTINVMTFDEYAQLYSVEKRVIELKHAEAKAISEVLKAFVPKDIGRVVPDEASNKVVLLVPPSSMEGIVMLVQLLDVPSPFAKDVVEVLRLEHLEAAVMVQMLEEFIKASESVRKAEKLTGKSTVQSEQEMERPTLEAGEGWVVKMMAEPKLNAVILRGRRGDVDKAIAVMKSLDVVPPVYIEGYPLKFTGARETFDTLRELVEKDERLSREGRNTGPRRLRLALSEQNNRIIVEGSTTDHARIKAIIEGIDKPLPPGSGTIRVYRLQNATSTEVAQVLQDLVKQKDRLGKSLLAKQERTEGPGVTPMIPRTEGAAPPPPEASPRASQTPSANGKNRAEQLTPGDILPAQITDAPEINSVIIRASAAEHEDLAAVIVELDKPREQVMIEVTLVTIRNDNGFRLGVEVGGARVNGRGTDLLGFTTYGVGTVDPAKGSIRIASPAPFGVNFAVFNVDDFSVVLRALQTVGDTRIASAPKILVLDNAEAEISRLNEEPFESSSQSNSSTLTSFGGFIEAGTTLTVTPHIADEDWLRLEYKVNLSSFGTRNAAQTNANLPPPRNTNTVHGVVRIPSEHMIVLGGLVNTRDDKTIDQIPFLGDIPLLGELLKNRTKNSVEETLFVFIRPVVLRDPSFADLMDLSDGDIHRAKLFKQSSLVNPLKMFVPESVPEPQDDEETTP